MQITPKSSEKKKGKVIISSIWTLSSNLMDRLISFISISILARLLTPKDFGLVAMATSIVAFADLINAFGLDWALVRHPEPTKLHYDTAWTLRILISSVSVICLLIIAYFAVKYFHQPALLPLISVMAISIFIGAIGNIGIVDFRRNLLFDREFIIKFWPKMVSFLVAVILAYSYHSYWALVIGTLTLQSTSTLMSYWMHTHRPKLTLKYSSELLSFSVWLLIGNTIAFFKTCFANLFIGQTFGAIFTGMYTLSFELAHLSITEIASPINRVIFTKYSQNAKDLNLIQEGFISTASIIWFLALPMALGIYFTSNEIVVLVLGSQWSQAGAMLGLLAIGAAVCVMVTNSFYVFWVLGLTKEVSLINGVSFFIMMMFSFILSGPYGFEGVAYAYILSIAIVVPVVYYLLWKNAKISVIKFVKTVWRISLASVGMLLILKGIFPKLIYHSSVEAIVPFIIRAVSGMGLYTVLLLILWLGSGRPEGPESFALNIIKSTLPWRKILAS